MSKRTHNSSRRGGGKGITFLNATLLSDSDHFAVPHKTVGNITSGRTWKHV